MNMFRSRREGEPEASVDDLPPPPPPPGVPETLAAAEPTVPDSLVDWYLNPEAPSPVGPSGAAQQNPPGPMDAGALPPPPPPGGFSAPSGSAEAVIGGMHMANAARPTQLPGDASSTEALPVLMERPPMTSDMLELKKRVQGLLIDRLGSRLYDSSVSEEILERNVIDELAGIFVEQAPALSEKELEQLSESLINDILGHGPIEPLLNDDSVSEIMVNGLDPVFIERSGRLSSSGIRFENEAQLRQVIDRIVSRIGRRVDESSPMVDARLPDGSRVNAIIPPLAVDGSSLTIRKFAKRALDAQDLVEYGTLTPNSVALLRAFVDGKLNILVSGGTGSGKTTLLNVLSNFIPDSERIVTIEDAVELRINKPHVVRLESRPPNLEGRGAVSIRDLVKNSLRMRPDRIVVGECRGSEALDMLQAMNTGHDGSLSTLHANTPRDAVSRVEIMVMMGGMDLPVVAIREQISSAVDLIVQLSRLRDGTRRVTHITEVVGMEGDTVTLSDIFLYEYDGVDDDGKYIGELRPTGLRPMILEKLAEHGIELASSVFGAQGGAADIDFSQF